MAVEYDGPWLQDWRRRNGYTQEELAKELVVSRQSIIKWEQCDKLDHTIVLALTALENISTLQNILGRKAMAKTPTEKLQKLRSTG